MDEFLSHTLTDWSLVEGVCKTKSISNTVRKCLGVYHFGIRWLHGFRKGDLAVAGQSSEFVERTHKTKIGYFPVRTCACVGDESTELNIPSYEGYWGVTGVTRQ